MIVTAPWFWPAVCAWLIAFGFWLVAVAVKPRRRGGKR